MDKNKDYNNSEDVIKISLTDLLVIIFSCVLVLILMGYICIISNYKETVEENSNYVSTRLNNVNENIIENRIENVVENVIENKIN